jgi:hypothetical protein
VGARDAATRWRHQAHHRPAPAPNAPPLRRVWDGRDADAGRRGLRGPREAADASKGQRKTFLRETLTLPVSEANPLRTPARPASARLLGDAVVPPQADDQHDRAHHRRRMHGARGRQGPVEGLRTQGAPSRRHGQPPHVAARLQATASSSVTHDHAAERGWVPSSLRALHVQRGWHVHRGRPRSLAKTLAHNHRPSVKPLLHKERAPVATPPGPLRGREVHHPRGEGTPPLSARGGGIALRWHRHGLRKAKPKEGDGQRSAVVPRRLAQTCARCGAQEPCAVPPSRRRADLPKPGRQENPLGLPRMRAYRRKTLVPCRACHEARHRARPGRRPVPF